MVFSLSDILERYPQLSKMQGKVPDKIILQEVGPKIEQFEHQRPLAQQMIETKPLGGIFPADLEKGRITLEDFLGQWGNISIEELCKICLIVAWVKPSSVFEFGTYNGLTAYQIATNTDAACRIYTLDISPDSASDLELSDIDKYLVSKANFFQFKVGHKYKGTCFESKIIQLYCDSTKMNFGEWYNQMDVVFVDAGHSYKYVKSDTENALRMVRRGGVIIWHDYMQVLYPDVTRCLYEYALTGLPLYHIMGTNLAVYHRFS